MRTVRELQPIAQRLDGFAFAKQMGPFVLMQRPDTKAKAPGGDDWATETAPLPHGAVRPSHAPVDYEDLLIATLPPPAKDGSLQLIVGRSPDCDVVLVDAAVSQKHAAIEWDGRTGVLRELGSANGTFLNGIRIGSRAVLRTGDELSFGDSHFVYLLSGELHARLLRRWPDPKP
ncbi:MAG: FHA domain-containing protein [Myxococcaceae bacterium]|nr:FHA domain-containing protein [Myxococcaceae bacterium]